MLKNSSGTFKKWRDTLQTAGTLGNHIRHNWDTYYFVVTFLAHTFWSRIKFEKDIVSKSPFFAASHEKLKGQVFLARQAKKLWNTVLKLLKILEIIKNATFFVFAIPKFLMGLPPPSQIHPPRRGQKSIICIISWKPWKPWNYNQKSSCWNSLKHWKSSKMQHFYPLPDPNSWWIAPSQIHPARRGQKSLIWITEYLVH